MYLKSLGISGFKSFAKKSKFEFNSPITAIVGPNGSGKSNVAEGFRFVLGEQSIKSLRGKKGEDLIFNGANGAPRSNRAEVAIVFDNSQKLLDIDFDEVEIKRVVHRDGINEYFINGSTVRLKDIIELLAGANIGSTGHHIISQGEADKILNANIKDRKSMIEDALGLKIYQYKINESQRKLGRTEENIKEVEIARKEIAPHLRFLRKQMEKIEMTAKMRDELKEKYLEYLKREKTYLDVWQERIKNRLSEPEKQIQELEKKLLEAREVLEKSKEKDEKSETVISLEKEIQEVRSEKGEVLRDIGKIEGEIFSYQKIIEKEQVRLSEEEGRTLPISEVKKFAGEIGSQISEIEKAGDLSSVLSIVSKVKDYINSFLKNSSGEQYSAVISDAEKEISRLKGEKEEKQTVLEESEGKEEDLQSKYSSLQKEIEADKDRNRDAEKAVFQIQAQQQQVQSIINDLNNQKRKLFDDDEAFKQEIQEGSVLVGHSILEYSKHVIKNENEKELSFEEIADEERKKQADRHYEIEKLKIRLEDSGVGAGEDVTKEFEEVSERDSFLEKELEDLEKSKSSLENLISELQEELKTTFADGIEKINKQFQEFFSLMFGGGNAKLSIVQKEKRRSKDDYLEDLSDEEIALRIEEEEEAEEGIDISVSLPRKKIKGLMMLSGGERALTSIALLFAMSQVNPPPFLILDETDAALDEANSKKYGDMVENLSKHSQLILITHNRETMSRAGILYGVTMDSSGISHLLSVKFDEAVEVAK